MYNPYQANTPFGRPPGFGGFPGQPGAPPGMGAPLGMAPPGMAAPGVAPPPGMHQNNASQPGRPGGLPPNFQPPVNMPNINFSAPVIRLGTSGPSKPATPIGGDSRRESNMDSRMARSGLGAGQGGMEAQRQALREAMLVPPTKDEILRTIFVGGITEGAGGDEGVERILRTAGNLRRWIRATDADNKPCRFGFAEYEDPESLSTAAEVLRDVEVPVKRQAPADDTMKVDADGIETGKLLVVIDDDSLSYLERYQASRGDQDPSSAQMRLDSARSALEAVLADLTHPSAPAQATDVSMIDRDGQTTQNGDGAVDGTQAEVVTIPLTVDDELSDIPAEMRETVAKEIAAFRDRSNRRDMERLKREEEIESMERQRNLNQPRSSRLASPPLSAPSGPAGGANGIPLGPRDRGVPNAPVGPKAYQGQQIPRDYQKGVTFVNGGNINGATTIPSTWNNREDEDDSADDSELEQRRRSKKEAELEKQYLDQERRWLNRERSRTAAVEREKARDKDEKSHQEAEKEAMAKRLREWNDDAESARKVEEYYHDRSLWLRNRLAFRNREMAADEQDRAAEEREKARDAQARDAARGMADDFLARQEAEMEAKTQPPTTAGREREREPQQQQQRFKLSLGAAAAQKAQQAAAHSSVLHTRRRAVAESVEGLLEDEEDADSATTKRQLVPIQIDPNDAAGADGAAGGGFASEEERAQAARQLAAEIPTDKEGLWKWPVQWEFVDESVLAEQLRPFVEKNIVEYLGVQEQMLVEVVEEHVRKRGGPADLVGELEGALDEEAEVLVKKLWRMIIFFSESEKRGLSAS